MGRQELTSTDFTTAKGGWAGMSVRGMESPGLSPQHFHHLHLVLPTHTARVSANPDHANSTQNEAEDLA